MNDKYLKESIDILNRKFGEPLPTLEDTTRAHSIKKEGGPGSGRKAKPGSAKDIDNRMSKAADDANARLDAAEKELKKKKMKKEDSLMENPAIAGAVAAMTRLQMQNPKTGKKISALTPLKNKEHPLHKKSKSMFQRIKDKLSKKKDKPAPKKQSKSDVDFYKRQFAGEVKEGPDDVRFARRAMSKIAKDEAKLRKSMFELEQAFLRDPRKENQKLAKDIKKNYKSNVTAFMRDSVQMIKRMK
tara:strand:+ start:554 stop:1282 length:729 start_codon:yes stop_codon:yes gene_type:complete